MKCHCHEYKSCRKLLHNWLSLGINSILLTNNYTQSHTVCFHTQLQYYSPTRTAFSFAIPSVGIQNLAKIDSSSSYDSFSSDSPKTLSFCRYPIHPEIRKGSPRARAIYETEVSTNWRFSTCKPLYLRNGTLTIGPKLLLITNNKLHTRFRLVVLPKSTTVDDPELTLNGHYALCCITLAFRSPLQKFEWRQTHTISDKNVTQWCFFLSK